MRKAKRTRHVVACAVVMMASPLVVLVAGSREAGAVQIDLAYETGGLVAGMYTPLKILHKGKAFAVNGSQGSVSLGGTSVPIAAAWDGRSDWVAMDSNNNGLIDKKEYVRVDQSGSVSFQLTLGENKICAVKLLGVQLTRQVKTIKRIYGGYIIIGCQKGTLNGVDVRVLDDNMDGQFTQDGKDAIAFGRSRVAVPLHKVHQIGPHHYELDVAEDGKSLTATPLSDVALGVVEVPFRSSALRCLAVSDDNGRSYDLAVSGKTGIPAGNYRLSYGVLESGGQMVVLKPTKQSLTYPIKADMINKIRIGKPLRVDFTARLEKAEGKITVVPSVKVLGAGNELYSFAFGGRMGTPRIVLAERGRTLTSEYMEHG